MASPAEHLPGPIAHHAINELLTSLRLPTAENITTLSATAEYHSIYMVTIPENDETPTNLILRISGHHLPRIKTSNEVAVMTWVGKNTSIPTPRVVAHDSSTNNPIGHEYTLLSRVEGETLSNIYSKLKNEQIMGVIDQLIEFLTQLHAQKWNAIGGLSANARGDIVPSRIVDETFWQEADLSLWPDGETVASLNVAGPYQSYVEYISAHIRQYIWLIRIHNDLAFMRADIPRLERFLDALAARGEELNTTKLCLAHKDLHFANILYDRATARVTAILDWEFSGVVPYQLWNPRKAFLWLARQGEEAKQEQSRLQELFNKRCRERGADMLLDDAAFVSPAQEAMQSVMDFIRAIMEVVPRKQRKELVPIWREKALENVSHFGI